MEELQVLMGSFYLIDLVQGHRSKNGSWEFTLSLLAPNAVGELESCVLDPTLHG